MEEEATVEEEEEEEESDDNDNEDVNKHIIFSIDVCEYNLATIFLFLSCKCIECL